MENKMMSWCLRAGDEWRLVAGVSVGSVCEPEDGHATIKKVRKRAREINKGG